MEPTAKLLVNIPDNAASHSVRELARNEPSDRELVRRCQRGDMAGYELLVRRYQQKVFGLAYSMVRNEQDATDIAQETFVRGWQGLRRFRGTSSFYTWLYRITTNLCIDFVRRRNRSPLSEFDESVPIATDPSVALAPSRAPSPAREAQRAELRERIDNALAQLSPEHRAAVQLREFDGLSYAEIARATGCSMGTVMSRLFYARKHLQMLLGEDT